jgi:hypothetical protein
VAGDPVFPVDNLEPWSNPSTMGGRPVAFRSHENRLPSSGVVPIFDSHHYARLNGSQPILVSPIVSAVVLAEPTIRRNFLALRNVDAAVNIYVDFGTEATLQSTFKLTPGQTVLFDTVVPQDDVYAISDGGVSAVLSISFSNSN